MAIYCTVSSKYPTQRQAGIESIPAESRTKENAFLSPDEETDDAITGFLSGLIFLMEKRYPWWNLPIFVVFLTDERAYIL